ncbi:MAG TPA: hypothetical protein VHF88_03200, partial [Thermoleophilaceae bacterium]|nr:hypothetical protein [Thermoleophilaceae bacterium]
RAAAQPAATTAPPAAPVGLPAASTPIGMLPAPASLETVTPSARSRPVATPPPRRAAPGCVTEIVSLDVAPNASALGAVFDSRAQQDGKTGIRVGTSFYPLPAGRAALLVLDAETLEDLSFTTVPTGLPVQAWAIEQTMRYQVSGRDVLMVLAGMPGCCADDPAYPSTGFTVVQRPGQSAGTIAQNRGLVVAAGGAPGQLTGYLQQSVPLDGAGPSYRLVSPDRVAFDTQASATPTTNTMRVGEATYPGALPAGASAGFHVLVIDAAQRPQLGTPTVFATNTGDAATDRQQEQSMNQLATAALKQPGTTTLVQSIGHPRPSSNVAWQLAVTLEQLGGTPWMFLGLDGSGDYALVGNPPPPGTFVNPVAAAEASSQWQGGGHGDLQGVLRRRGDRALYAPLADPVGTPDYGLAEVVYQPPTAWPQTDTPGKIAATSYLATQLGLLSGPGSCYQPPKPDFRSSYCNESIDVDALDRQLDRIAYPSGTSDFSKPEFDAVVAQLDTELDYVGDVRALVTSLQKPFGTAEIAPAVDSSEIAGQLVAALPPKPGSALSGDLELASSILYVGAEVPVVGEALGPIASVLDLASVLTEQDAQLSPDWDIQTTADKMGGEIEGRLQAMSGALGLFQDVLVSDYGKLSTAATDAESAWGVNGAGIDEQISTLELGVKQWLWTAILPSAFDLIKVPGVPLDQPGQAWCVYSRAPAEWRPWQKAPPASVFFPFDGMNGTQQTASAMFGMLSGKFSDRSSETVTPGLARLLFASPDTSVGPGQPTPAGLVRPWLFERARWTVRQPKMVQPDSGLVPGYCGVGDT